MIIEYAFVLAPEDFQESYNFMPNQCFLFYRSIIDN